MEEEDARSYFEKQIDLDKNYQWTSVIDGQTVLSLIEKLYMAEAKKVLVNITDSILIIELPDDWEKIANIYYVCITYGVCNSHSGQDASGRFLTLDWAAW